LWLFSPAASHKACGLDDGFGASVSCEGKYFTVYYAPQLDASALARQLDVSAADKILIGGSTQKWGSDSQANASGQGLVDMLDTLFLQVSDTLDMHIYSFHGSIKICRDYAHVNSIYKGFFDKDSGNDSMYVSDLNTIYISAGNFKREVLGHEIAHAIISRYFVVQPPVKVAEVLAGYVEYQLRKKR
jgi:hypothetical protein